VPYADHEFFEDRARVMMDDSASGDANRAATADLARYLGTLLQQRRTEPTPTTCTAGSAPSRSSRGTLRGEAASMAVLLLVAGHETTANQIALSVAFRLENPQHAEALRRRKARPPEPSTSCCGC
jgi:cytochrome P450